MVLINTAPKHKALNPIHQGPAFRASTGSHAPPSINRHRDIAEDVPQQRLQPCLLCVPDFSELKLPGGNTDPDSAPHELIRGACVQHLKPKTSAEQASLTWSRHSVGSKKILHHKGPMTLRTPILAQGTITGFLSLSKCPATRPVPPGSSPGCRQEQGSNRRLEQQACMYSSVQTLGGDST